MAEQDRAPAAPAAAPRAGQPRLTLHSQYLKDFSFENLQPPADGDRPGRPKGEVSVDLHLEPMEGGTYEVSLRLKVDAKLNDKPAYLVEADYCGRFEVATGPDVDTRKILMVRAPAMLFPFARAVVYSATREGGFPALNINPVDFNALYRLRLRGEKKKQDAGA